MSAPAAVRRRIRVAGRVQGVGFRYFVQSVARNLGVVGWVRNEPDGSVLAEAQGAAPAVEAFLGHVRQGPAHAHVTDAAVTELPCREPAETAFTIERGLR